MTTQVLLRCRCGKMQGMAHDISPKTCSRLVCYCDDCQAFARALGGDDVLDAHGGSDVLHLTPSQVRITQGMEELACMRLSHKGMMRWHTRCCNTPIANTMSMPGLPFVSLFHVFLAQTVDGQSLDDVLGPPVARIQSRFAVGGAPPGAHPTAPFGFIAHSVYRLLGAWLHGKQAPSPFFDLQANRPRVTPRVLSVEERARL